MNELESAEVYQDYMTSIYFVMCTATTIGYGDLTIESESKQLSDLKYVYAIFLIVFAMIFYSFFIRLSRKLFTFDKKYNKIFDEEFEALEDWLAARDRNRSASSSLKIDQGIKEFYKYFTVKNFIPVLHLNGYLNQMPPRYREIVQAICSLHLIESFKWLKSLPENLAMEICLMAVQKK